MPVARFPFRVSPSQTARPLLTALAFALVLALGSGAGAVDFPFHLGPVVPTPMLNPDGLTCAPPADPLELALWRVVTAGGRPDHSCGNAFVGYQRTPRTAQQPDAFQETADQIRAARREVLLTSMEWHAGEGQPGWIFAQGVRDLYARVRADPGAYPDGMTVRLSLGGFPDLRREDGGTQALQAVRDLTRLGVPLSDAAIGWHLAVANYSYFPHSHVKLHVIDGADLTVAGYNYTSWHLPSGQGLGGQNLHDLGLRMRGPVAGDGVTVFDDLWRHSRQVRCPADVTADRVLSSCTLGRAEAPTHRDAARTLRAAGTARAFVLYRRPGFDEADRGVLALFGAARGEIDLMEANFSPKLQCWYAFLQPDDCPPLTWPPYLQALLAAMERGVKVRVLTVDYGIDRDANRSGIALLRLQARKRGIEDRFDARSVSFLMHTKAFTVDGRMVVAGSLNLHFSSWGPLGLNEAVLATTDPAAVAEQRASFGDVWAHASRPVPPEWWMRNVP